MDTNDLFEASEFIPFDLDHFERRGWWGPCRLLTAQGVKEVSYLYQMHRHRFTPPQDLIGLDNVDQLATRPWFKSMHMWLPLFSKIALHTDVLERVGPLLGDDLIIWGFSIVERDVRQRHRWHADVEHGFGPGVTMFLGLEGASLDASLTVLEGSHKIISMPQDLALETNQQVMDYGKHSGLSGSIVTLPVSPGSFLLMHGLLWHTSYNTSRHRRLAAIIQYSAADTPVRIPTTWNGPVRWLAGWPPYLRVRDGKVLKIQA